MQGVDSIFVYVETCVVSEFVISFGEIPYGAEKKVYSFVFE